jgi:hypothetical protein
MWLVGTNCREVSNQREDFPSDVIHTVRGSHKKTEQKIERIKFESVCVGDATRYCSV